MNLPGKSGKGSSDSSAWSLVLRGCSSHLKGGDLQSDLPKISEHFEQDRGETVLKTVQEQTIHQHAKHKNMTSMDEPHSDRLESRCLPPLSDQCGPSPTAPVFPLSLSPALPGYPNVFDKRFCTAYWVMDS